MNARNVVRGSSNAAIPFPNALFPQCEGSVSIEIGRNFNANPL